MSESTQAKCVVVYDGECGFCRRQVDRMRRRDRGHCFEYVARQAPGILDRFPMLSEGDFQTGMRLVMPDRQVFVGADAVYQIAKRLRGWRLLAWLYRVPGLHRLSRAAYAWVASHRYALAGRCDDGSCPP